MTVKGGNFPSSVWVNRDNLPTERKISFVGYHDNGIPLAGYYSGDGKTLLPIDEVFIDRNSCMEHINIEQGRVIYELENALRKIASSEMSLDLKQYKEIALDTLRRMGLLNIDEGGYRTKYVGLRFPLK